MTEKNKPVKNVDSQIDELRKNAYEHKDDPYGT